MNPQSEKLLAALKSADADTRYAAWVAAAAADPEVVPELGKLLTAEQPGVRKAADEGLKKIVHSVGKAAGGARRAAVVKGLLGLAGEGQPKWTRTVALRHLSAIGGDETVAPAAKLLADPELREEAVFCLERIPGAASDAALMTAANDAKDDFKPRILAALGHRRVAAAAPLCAAAMTSSNVEVALAGMKALGRIGRDPGRTPSTPDFESLSDFQKTEFSDSVVRYAEGMAESGNVPQAIRLYKIALDRGEEHLQCAGIVGLGRLKSPEAAALVEGKLQSGDRNVRITANRVWAAIKKA